MDRKVTGLVPALLFAFVSFSLVQCGSGGGSDDQPPHTILVLVSNADSSDVSVIDPATFDVTTLDPADAGYAGSEPRNLAVSSDYRTLYIPFRFSDNVLVADTTTPGLVREITDLGFDEPYAVAFTEDNSEAWVVNKQGGGSSTGSVTIINTATHTVITTVNDAAFSSPEGIAIANGKAYVVNRGNGTVTVVSVASRGVLTTIATDIGSQPRFAVATPNGAYVYVSNTTAGVTRIQTSNNATTPITTPFITRNLAVTPDGTKIFAGTQNDSIIRIRVSDNNVATIDVTVASSIYGVAVISDGTLGFATDESRDVVYVFDPGTETMIMDGPNPLEIPVGSTPRAILGL